MKEKFILYVHISPSNKMYFGITCKSTYKRWGKNGAGYSNNTYFWNAIQKYGWNNFKHIIIATDLQQDWAVEIEKALILKYKTYKFEYGYNRAIGGEFGGVGYRWNQTKEVKQHLSKLKKGVPFTEEHKENLRKAWNHRKAIGKGTAWNKGLNLKGTEKLDNFIKAGIVNAEKQKRKIYQLDLIGNIIAEYNSVTEASKAVGASSATGIFAVANGRQNTAYGYKWKYKEWEEVDDDNEV